MMRVVKMAAVASAAAATATAAKTTPPPPRPALLSQAAPSDHIYYVGVGSNMLKSKLVNRGLNGSKIEVIDFRGCSIRGHRLAFNLRGFPPLEPGMGGLEPASPTDECHGALCTMTRTDYEKVWLSEGGGTSNPGYEEIEVEATPYGSASPVRALALRARPHARLSTDACPSERYMGILISGAEELGLEAAYISKLRAIRVGRAIHAWTTRIASVSRGQRANTAAVSTSKHEPQPSQLPTTHIPPPCYLRPRG